MVKNVLLINPANCSKVLSNYIGYTIHDGNDKLILKVETTFEDLGQGIGECFVTRITANLYDKSGKLVFKANHSEGDPEIATSAKSAFGFSGAFAMALGMSENELILAGAILTTSGAIHRCDYWKNRERRVVVGWSGFSLTLKSQNAR